jgi:hypothetical protein
MVRRWRRGAVGRSIILLEGRADAVTADTIAVA